MRLNRSGPAPKKKGPDVGSKSLRTRYRYRKLLSNQVDLIQCGFTWEKRKTGSKVSLLATSGKSKNRDEDSVALEVNEELLAENHDIGIVRLRKRKRAGNQDDDELVGLGLDHQRDDIEEIIEDGDLELEATGMNVGIGQENSDERGEVMDSLKGNDNEDWEDELDEMIVAKSNSGAATDIRSWHDLRAQIVNDLSHKSKTLSLSHINQLMILRNFATLQLKGYTHYQASIAITTQWRMNNTSGTYFALKIRSLACLLRP